MASDLEIEMALDAFYGGKIGYCEAAIFNKMRAALEAAEKARGDGVRDIWGNVTEPARCPECHSFKTVANINCCRREDCPCKKARTPELTEE